MTFDEAMPYILRTCNKWASMFRDLERDELVNEVWLTCDFSKFKSANGGGLVRHIQHKIISYIRKILGKPGSGRNNLQRRSRVLTDNIGRGFAGFDKIDSVNECDYLLSGLKPESRQILDMYYRQGITMQEIGGKLGCSKATISNRHAAILEHLRKKAG